MLNTPPHLEARVPRGFVSIFHGTSSSVARRRLRASDLSFRQSMPSFDIGRPGLQMQSGASAVLGGVGELPGSRCTDFNPRAPCGGATSSLYQQDWWREYFNPRAPCGARPLIVAHVEDATTFQSTRPVWGATSRAAGDTQRGIYFNPRAPCGARHALLADAPAPTDFNPRAPCGARPQPPLLFARRPKISIHAPRVGRDYRRTQSNLHHIQISIHAPRVGRDQRREVRVPGAGISIHAPRVGRDLDTRPRSSLAVYFNPRAPCGARHQCL